MWSYRGYRIWPVVPGGKQHLNWRGLVGIITSRSPLTFHRAFQLFNSSKLIAGSLCHPLCKSMLKKFHSTNAFPLKNTLSANPAVHFITRSRGVWILPACGEEMTVVQISNKNQLARGNLQTKVSQCCCVAIIRSCLLDTGTLSSWKQKGWV